MMEHNTDRLFWALTSVIVAALLMTILVKAYPKLAEHIFHPYTQSTAYNITNPDNRPQPKEPQAYVVNKGQIPYTQATNQVPNTYQ